MVSVLSKSQSIAVYMISSHHPYLPHLPPPSKKIYKVDVISLALQKLACCGTAWTTGICWKSKFEIIVKV